MATQKKQRGRSARYETASLMLRLALDLMAPGYGLTLAEIQRRYKLSRSTALRMLSTLESWPEIEFKYPGPQEGDDPRVKRWQIVGANLRDFSAPTPAELAALNRAAEAFKDAGLPRERTALASLSRKVAALASGTGIKTASDLEDQLQVRGLLMRPGPRLDSDADTIDTLDAALSTRKQVEILYRSAGNKKATLRTLCPFGILSGRWAYLVAFDPEFAGKAIATERLKTYRIDRIESLELLLTPYERPNSPTLAEYAQRSFGVYQDRDEPSEIVWRFSPEVADEAERFQFHPTQLLEREEDGSLIVRFRAGGLREMVQHLFTWRGDVEVIAPEALRGCWAEELAISREALRRSKSRHDRKSRP
jgi:predicted DNA-binding transcriptional regulator YafY